MPTTDSDLTAHPDPVPSRPEHRDLPDGPAHPSVRDLIAELAATEDVLREHRRSGTAATTGATGPTGAPGSTDLAVRHRQHEILTELRRRRRARLR